MMWIKKLWLLSIILTVFWLSFSIATYCWTNKYWNKYCTYDDWSYEYRNWDNEWNPYKWVSHYKSSSSATLSYDWFTSAEEAEAYADWVRYEEEQMRKEKMEYEEYCENHWPEDWCPSHWGKWVEILCWIFAAWVFWYLWYYMFNS